MIDKQKPIYPMARKLNDALEPVLNGKCPYDEQCIMPCVLCAEQRLCNSARDLLRAAERTLHSKGTEEPRPEPKPLTHGIRPCMVDDKRPALFHRWVQESYVVEPSPFVGGGPGGQVNRLWALVEYENGEVEKINPTYLRFTDQKEDVNHDD